MVRNEPVSAGRNGTWSGIATIVALVLGLVPLTAAPAHAARTGFDETVAFDGLDLPTAVAFSPGDDRVFVAEKRGVVKVFDSLDDETASVYADLRTQVYNSFDKGLLGLAVHPDYPRDPRIYVLYTYDAAIGGSAPRWGDPDGDFDDCPDPPGAIVEGCVTSGRLSVLTPGAGGRATEKVLVNDWCVQFSTHSVGDLEFGADGALYVSAGDGASFTFADYGQRGNPTNPCGDPPGGAGARLTPPTAQGGALRSQDLRTGGDPAGLDGSILRLDPDTGKAMATNPRATSSDPNVARTVAYGLRNPFRIAIRPGTSDVFVGDVGWNRAEEINRIAEPTAGVRNFGWPCYEANGRQRLYDEANLKVCEDLYDDGAPAHDTPWFSYAHDRELARGDGCSTGSSSSAGLSFYPGGDYPPQYDGALFTADFSRKCIWVMFANSTGIPDPSTVRPFVAPAASPVDLTNGPDGDLYYANIGDGEIRRVSRDPNVPTDIAGTKHEDAILWLVAEKIALGFDDGTFRPGANVTRGQMASFLQRALDLPIPDEPPIPLRDIAGNEHEDAIKAIAAADITVGFEDNTFRPGARVTRGQMASFLQRALDLPIPDEPPIPLRDIAGNEHEDAIKAIAAADITVGFEDNTFRPGANVTRGQMASFLYRALADE